MKKRYFFSSLLKRFFMFFPKIESFLNHRPLRLGFCWCCCWLWCGFPGCRFSWGFFRRGLMPWWGWCGRYHRRCRSTSRSRWPESDLRGRRLRHFRLLHQPPPSALGETPSSFFGGSGIHVFEASASSDPRRRLSLFCFLFKFFHVSSLFFFQFFQFVPSRVNRHFLIILSKWR